MMNTLIMQHWSAEQRALPGMNGIFLADGTSIMLNIHSCYNPNDQTRTLSCSPWCDTTIASLVKYHEDCWTMVDPWTRIDYEGGSLYGGDGQMGNEGFIARTDADDRLIWGIFFDVTNPIKSLSVQKRTLIAINEHQDMRIEINLDTLVDINLIPLK